MDGNASTTQFPGAISQESDWWIPISLATSSILGIGIHLSGANGKISKPLLVAVIVALVATQIPQTNWTESIDPRTALILIPITIGVVFQALNGFIHGCIHLFFSMKFTHHRWLGLVYLLQWVTACVMYAKNYEAFKNSHITWTLPINGVIQSITATYYFRFLPKKQDGGYCSDKSALSRGFVAENIFFAGLLLAQWMYYSDWVCAAVPMHPVGRMVLESTFVFFPYVIRLAFPQTSFRDSINDPNNKSEDQKMFWVLVTSITKAFYIWAKHYMGFFLNYVRFLDRVTPNQQYHIFSMLIFSCAATTIAIFLHTLAFKHYITKRTSFLVYMVTYGLTFYSWARMFGAGIFTQNLDLVAVTFLGLLINFGPRKFQFVYQFVVMAGLQWMRYNSPAMNV